MHHFNPIASFGRTAVVATSLLSMASAHMFLAEPKPIQGNAIKDPLDPSGSNFPCHGAALPTSGGQKLVAGETFPLKLELADGANTAVHGGGSCQLAILSDTTNAADPASWNVIYSIEGGCPSNTKGNLDNTPNGAVACTSNDQGDCVHSWDVPMPKGVKSGNAILSWTWFNTIGNREMYQNCVNVDITGGSGDGTFPPLFVANLAGINSVVTTAESDVLFPEPGEFVTIMSATNGFNQAKATVASGDSPKGPGGYTAPKETSAPAYSAPASAPAYSAPASSAPAYSAPTQIASQIQSYDNQKQKQTYTTFATATSAVAAPSTAAPSSEAPAPTSYSSGSSDAGSNATSPSDFTKCSEDGALICIGNDSFGICDHGAAVKRPLAKGTACTNGVISGINRFRRHAHGAAHKH
ncbi:hypothetical protein Q7P36_001202 [Cladosporium allicinum]